MYISYKVHTMNKVCSLFLKMRSLILENRSNNWTLSFGTIQSINAYGYSWHSNEAQSSVGKA